MKFLSSRALLWGAGIAVAATVAGLAGFSYLPRGNAAPSGAMTHAAQAVPVSVAVVEQRNVTTWDEFSGRSEEHTSELQSLMRISYAVFCLKKKTKNTTTTKQIC